MKSVTISEFWELGNEERADAAIRIENMEQFGIYRKNKYIPLLRRPLDLSRMDTAGVTSMSGMFKDMRYQERLDLSALDTSSVTDMEEMFSFCAPLREIDLTGFHTSKVENMKQMFLSCRGVRRLDLSSFDTRQVRSMEAMLRTCERLEEVDLSSFDTGRVKSMAYMFSFCKSLVGIDLSSFDFSSVRDMQSMFDGCTALREVIVNNTFFSAPCEIVSEKKEKTASSGRKGREYAAGDNPAGTFEDDYGVYVLGDGNSPSQAWENRVYISRSTQHRVIRTRTAFGRASEAQLRKYLGLYRDVKLTVVPKKAAQQKTGGGIRGL